MEHQDSVTEIRSSDGGVQDFSFVTPITLNLEKAEDAKKLSELWEKVKTQEYAFDDFSRGRADAFLQWFLDPRSLHFYIGNQSGYCVVRNIYPESVPSIGFVIWDHNLGMTYIKNAGQEVVDYVFKTFGCHRIDAYVPSYNKFARRVATMLRFRFEGNKREAVRYGGKWHDIEIFGLLATQKGERVQ